MLIKQSPLKLCCLLTWSPGRQTLVFWRFSFLLLFHTSYSRLGILCKSRHHTVHWAPLGVLLSRPPDKRTLLLGLCFSQLAFYLFLPRCAAPHKRTYRDHGCTYNHHGPAHFCRFLILVWGFSWNFELRFLSRFHIFILV